MTGVQTCALPILKELKEHARTLDQNAKLHAMCGDLSKQVLWAGAYLDTEDWKRIIVASIWGQKVVPSIDGKGFVVLNKRTGKMNKMQCSEVIEALYCFGAEKEVKWTHDELETV